MRRPARGTVVAAVLMAGLLVATPAAAETAQDPIPPPVRSAPPVAQRPSPATALFGPINCAATREGDATPVAALDEGERMQLAVLHRLATGAGQRVAVIDTGVYAHRGLDGRLRGGGDFLTGEDGLQDCDGHGTAVAGIIAARPVQDTAATADTEPSGMVGMAPDAEVLSIRQSSNVLTIDDGNGRKRSPGNTDTLAEAIVLAVDQGATVINMSEVACVPADLAGGIGEPVHAALDHAARRDVVVVAAAGNVSPTECTGVGVVSLPGWYDDDVLTVGAVDAFDSPATFTFGASYVDVAAPGTGVHSLAVGGGYTTAGLDGTSFAAPWVAGLAALLRERFPELSARQVVDRITATARRPAGGRTAAVGYGVIDPVAALTAGPDVLGGGAAGPELRLAATLPGTTPRPGLPAPGFPFDLLAMGVLVVVGTAGALRLRRR